MLVLIVKNGKWKMENQNKDGSKCEMMGIESSRVESCEHGRRLGSGNGIGKMKCKNQKWGQG
jgi:hypothetical protein